jgi:hypothetical protein
MTNYTAHTLMATMIREVGIDFEDITDLLHVIMVPPDNTEDLLDFVPDDHLDTLISDLELIRTLIKGFDADEIQHKIFRTILEMRD